MIKRGTVYPLFAAPVMKINMNIDEKKMLRYIKKEKYRITRTAKGCYQSVSNKILENKEMKKEKLIFIDYIKHYLKHIFHYSGKFKISNSWLTKTLSQCESQFHMHKNNWMSACYYPEEHKEFKISFFRGNAGSLIEVDYDDYQSIYSCDEFNLTPEKSSLIIFPSYVLHKISKNLSDKNRYSLAFNINPIGHFKKGSDIEVIYN